jgi:hypothetical protein
MDAFVYLIFGVTGNTHPYFVAILNEKAIYSVTADF